jgi:hypothetical protein
VGGVKKSPDVLLKLQQKTNEVMLGNFSIKNWIVIGWPIHYEKQVWICIVNHKFLIDWIGLTIQRKSD